MKSFAAAGLFFLAGLAHAAGMLAETPCDAALARFDYAQATQAADAALEHSRQDAAAWVCLARARYEQGNFRSALEALDEAEKLPAPAALGVRLGNWYGVTLRRLGRGEEAWRHQQAALALAQKIGDQAGLATALHNTAGMRYDRGDAFGALRDYQASIPINPDLAERSASFNNTGLIYQVMGDMRRARQSLEAAIVLNRAGNHFHHLGKHLMNLGNLERTQGRYDEARRLLDEGRVLIEKSGDVFWLGVAAHYRAWLANDLRQPEAARAAYAEALRDYQQAGAAGDAARLETEISSMRAY
jgi:tetratricopeptide (TPR) repeat protein